ncbi:MAG: SDR family NAD(P)-dependent oxidoreductase, partial [Oscillospiraceae bacterium]|nr:SDR family NAD(P)-dependent oxidoreductase [Oscillospiraceae bacterium]
MGKIAIVTGGSSGIGKQAAEYLRSHDCVVYEFSRKGEDRRGIRHITADVTDEASVNAAVEQVLAAEGRIDILVNNAGFGISGAAEFTSVEEAQRQLDV